ncbi:MAG: glutathione S-transferase [Myxococcota bacterium]
MSLDGYERWGRGSSYGGLEHHQVLAGAIPETDRRLAALALELRREDPEGHAWFVASRLTLLDAVMAAVDPDSTEYSVASKERTGWEAFGRGDGPVVKQNCYYVRLDRPLFQSLYGFTPSNHGLT